jgi:hypothetical protein
MTQDTCSGHLAGGALQAAALLDAELRQGSAATGISEIA